MRLLDARITWTLIAWLTPLWWATFLLAVACLGDVFPSWRAFASRLFDHLESAPLFRASAALTPNAHEENKDG